jgi:DNA-binding response OmpR family regulator
MTDARDHGVPIPGALISVTALWPAPKGKTVQATSLAGHTILIVEDEPYIALDIATACETVGALVLSAATRKDAACLVEHAALSAAVLDFGLKDGDADGLCLRLNERNIPYVLHSGYTHCGDACRRGIVIPKPAHPTVLVKAILELLRRPP